MVNGVGLLICRAKSDVGHSSFVVVLIPDAKSRAGEPKSEFVCLANFASFVPLMSSKSSIPNKLIFSGSTPHRKKRTIIAVCILVMVQCSLIWPIYPLFGDPEPLILGFPKPFAWVILMVCISFTTLLVLFLKDNKEQE